jgi:hypothetical protein
MSIFLCAAPEYYTQRSQKQSDRATRLQLTSFSSRIIYKGVDSLVIVLDEIISKKVYGYARDATHHKKMV